MVNVLLQEVIDAVGAVRKAAADGDNDVAHVLEDALHVEVLAVISTGRCRDAPPEDFAEEALKTRGIGFDRWYS